MKTTEIFKKKNPVFAFKCILVTNTNKLTWKTEIQKYTRKIIHKSIDWIAALMMQY